ncbi:hypothetical protein GA062_20755 [Escherichia coli]|nr:hypothetical protein [Escherichia coli]
MRYRCVTLPGRRDRADSPSGESVISILQVIKDSLTLRLNVLMLTDVTKNAAYGVEIESLVLEINTPTS